MRTNALRARWKWYLRGVYVLLSLPILYLVGANALLNSGVLPRLLNQHPEEARIEWRRAWSPWPGWVEVRDFYMRGQQPDLQWELTVDSATLRVDLSALLSERFQTRSVVASGVEYRVRPRLSPAEDAAGAAADFPPIRGFEHALREAPGVSPARPGPPDVPWVVQLERVKLLGLREIWIGPYRAALEAEVEGRLEILAGKYLNIGPAALDLRQGRVALGSLPVAQKLSGRIELTARIIDALRLEGLEFLKSFDAKAKIAGDLDSLDILSRYVPVEFEGGQARLALDAGLRHGIFTNGSSIELNGAELIARVLDFKLRGGWRIVGRIDGKKDGRSGASLSIEVNPFHLDDAQGSRVFETAFASATVTGTNLFLGRIPDDWRLDADLSPTEPFPLEFLNAQIAGSPFRFNSGDATVGAYMSIGPGSPDRHGSLVIRTGRFSATLGRRTFRGEGTLDLDLTRLRIGAQSVDFAGSTLEVRNVVVVGADRRRRAWKGKMLLESAVVALRPELRVDALISGRFSDARPFLSVFGTGAGLPDWAVPFLEARGLRVRGHLSLADERLSLRDLAADGKDLRIRGRLGLNQEIVRALFLITVHQFSAAVRVRGPRVHTELWHPEEWFRRQLRGNPE